VRQDIACSSGNRALNFYFLTGSHSNRKTTKAMRNAETAGRKANKI